VRGKIIDKQEGIEERKREGIERRTKEGDT